MLGQVGHGPARRTGTPSGRFKTRGRIVVTDKPKKPFFLPQSGEPNCPDHRVPVRRSPWRRTIVALSSLLMQASQNASGLTDDALFAANLGVFAPVFDGSRVPPPVHTSRKQATSRIVGTHDQCRTCLLIAAQPMFTAARRWAAMRPYWLAKRYGNRSLATQASERRLTFQSFERPKRVPGNARCVGEVFQAVRGARGKFEERAKVGYRGLQSR